MGVPFTQHVFPVNSERVDGGAGQVHPPPRLRSLGLLQYVMAIVVAQRLPYRERPGPEIDILPLQPKEFAAPHACSEREDVQRIQSVRPSHTEEDVGLL